MDQRAVDYFHLSFTRIDPLLTRIMREQRLLHPRCQWPWHLTSNLLP